MDKVIVTTGGTGGHIFPALAVIEEIRRENPSAEILFVGSEYGKERELTAQAGVPFAALPARGFLGKGMKAFSGAFGIMKSVFMARKIIRDFRPRIILGCGGYASFGPVLAGLTLGIPSVLHEQNAIAGSSNRLLAMLGAKVCVSLPKTEGFRQQYLSGNPVRSALFKLPPHEFGRSKNLFILGGSQGAHALNEFIIELLPVFKKNGISLLHQTGKNDLERVRGEYEKNGYDPECARGFIQDMGKAYHWADLVFCRAGASTIAELCATGAPAVFVPFPAAIHDHQTYNANLLANAGGARLVPQKDLDADKTGGLLQEMLNKPERLREMSASLKKMAQPDAAKNVVSFMKNLVRD